MHVTALRRDLARVNTERMVPQSRPPILITRPQPQASRFARQLRGLEWTGKVLVSPLLEPVFLNPIALGLPFHAVILTSETAALAARNLPGLPKLAFCVGDRTAQVARRLGFTARSAMGNASDLLDAIVDAGKRGPLLYLHGRETTGSLAVDLNSAGIETHSLLAYAQNPRPLGPEALRLICQPGPVILPILSPRSAALLVAAWQSAGAKATAHVAALSPAIAKAAASLHPETLAIAERPDGDSLLAAIRHLGTLSGWA